MNNFTLQYCVDNSTSNNFKRNTYVFTKLLEQVTVNSKMNSIVILI